MIFPNGTESITTFWEDFTIADRFGIKAIKDTYKRAFNEWKSDYKYLTELVIVLNLKCWYHYDHGRQDLSQVYSDLFYKAKHYADSHLHGEEFEYYWQMTD